jgi:hypothetical protein
MRRLFPVCGVPANLLKKPQGVRNASVVKATNATSAMLLLVESPAVLVRETRRVAINASKLSLACPALRFKLLPDDLIE